MTEEQIQARVDSIMNEYRTQIIVLSDRAVALAAENATLRGDLEALRKQDGAVVPMKKDVSG